MRTTRRVGILVTAAVTVLGLAVPGVAKKGGVPGAPSGSDLEVSVQADTFAWANSAGDLIPFEIVVANHGTETMTVDSVVFASIRSIPGEAIETELSGPLTLAKNEARSFGYGYEVTPSDLAGLPLQEDGEVALGTVTASAVGLDPVSTPAVTSVYPVAPCRDSGTGAFTVEAAAGTRVCSDSFGTADYWKLEVTNLENGQPTVVKGRGKAPLLTVRDGAPGNWCMVLPASVEGQSEWPTSTGSVVFVYFPSDGTCLGGGAAGDTIPTRNDSLFYVAFTDRVDATPCTGGVSTGDDGRLVCVEG